MTAQPHNAGERLAAVKRDLPKIEKQIDLVVSARRTAILAGNVGERRQCDGELRALRDDLQAARDAIDWLPQQVARESVKTWPSNRRDAERALAATESARLRYEAVPQLDRSANHQTQCDALKQRSYALLKLIKSLPPENKETAA